MENFSYRWGLPTNREEEAGRRPGRRSVNAVPCRQRLRGWLRNVCERSTSWGDVDIAAFCKATGYSREHATRELSRIRRESREFVFETKQRRMSKNRRKRWGVIVAYPAKLRFDRHSLFFGLDGKPLHNYTTLAVDGRKIQKQRPEVIHNDRVCDNPNKKKDSFGIQQKELNGAERDFAQWRKKYPGRKSESGLLPLRRKAFSMLRSLETCHWDNCKVEFSNRTAFCFCFQALVEGHDEKRITDCYRNALFVCHGHAVDQAASEGKILFFKSSSTVSKARKFLEKDGLCRKERIKKWYRNNPHRNGMTAPSFLNIEETRAQILATFSRPCVVDFGTHANTHPPIIC